jgi:predicted nucleic acid-binding Zn ribbon protein
MGTATIRVHTVRLEYRFRKVTKPTQIGGWMCWTVKGEHRKELAAKDADQMLDALLRMKQKADVVAFAKRYGAPFDEEAFLAVGWEKKEPASIRKYRRGKNACCIPLDSLLVTRRGAQYVLKTVDVFSRGVSRKARLPVDIPVAFSKIAPDSELRGLRREVSGRLVESLDVMFRLMLRGARVTFSNIDPVLVADGSISAVYLYLWKRIADKRPIALCPGCGNTFEVSREGKKWCSEKCRKAHKARQRRAKAKGKVKKKARR